MKQEIENIISSMKDSEWIRHQAREDLKTMTEEYYLKNRLKKGLVGWDHPMFTVYKKKQQEQDDYIVNQFEVEEGVITCGKCGGKRVLSTTVQTRSADEPMTTIAQCVRCKTKWTYSG